jgi:hypothetical protein
LDDVKASLQKEIISLNAKIANENCENIQEGLKRQKQAKVALGERCGNVKPGWLKSKMKRRTRMLRLSK